MKGKAKREEGVALLVVLGLVALVSVWASTAAYEDMIELRRAEDIQDNAQALLASQSAMALARKILFDDMRMTKTDNLREAWAQVKPPMPVKHGSIGEYTVDENRYFNLNDLVNAKGVAQPEAIAIARRLFVILKLNPGLVDALVDWMDADDRPSGPMGAEDAAYMDKPYRVKNARMDRWDELRMIKGFTDKVVNALATVAVVGPVPITGITPININTTNKDVLLAVIPSLNSATADAFIGGRPYASVSAATSQPWAQGVTPGRLSVNSDTFMVRTDAKFGRAEMREEYVLVRLNGNQVNLWSRERLDWRRP